MNRPLCLFLVLALASCASQPPHAPFIRVPPGSAVRIERFDGITDSGPPDSKVGERAFEGGVIGAAAGAQAGFEMGLSSFDGCGEFFPVCIGLIPVMGAIGLVGGVIVGSIAGGIEDSPYKSTQRMQQVINTYIEEAPLNETFREHFVEIASDDWRIDSSAETEITVAVIGLRPKKASGKSLVFEITTAMTVDYAADGLPATKPYQYTAATAAHKIDDWIDGGQTLYSSEIDRVFAEAAEVFESLLRDPPR